MICSTQKNIMFIFPQHWWGGSWVLHFGNCTSGTSFGNVSWKRYGFQWEWSGVCEERL